MPNIPFKAFTVEANGIANRLMTEVLISELCDESTFNTSKNVKVNAVWDTGATGTCIKPVVARALGLTPTGISSVETASGIVRTPNYLVTIVLPNKVVIPTVSVTALDENNSTECLIGMDVISFGDLSISTFNSKTCMTFRIPSYKRIDFVDEHYKIIYKGVQSYHNCPCGKKDSFGRFVKYKDCCQKKIQENSRGIHKFEFPDNGHRVNL